VTQAFLPALIRSGGVIVNNVSMMAFAPVPVTPAYAISKGGERRGGIFPDPMSESAAEGWRADVAKALERQFATFV
jgi:hypothetical protein